MIKGEGIAGWELAYIAAYNVLYIVMQIVVTHRIAWWRGWSGAFCDASTVSAGTLIGPGHFLACTVGCSGNLVSLQYQCTDFSVNEDWSAGQGRNEVTLSGVAYFEAS